MAVWCSTANILKSIRHYDHLSFSYYHTYSTGVHHWCHTLLTTPIATTNLSISTVTVVSTSFNACSKAFMYRTIYTVVQQYIQ